MEGIKQVMFFILVYVNPYIYMCKHVFKVFKPTYS